MTTPLTSSQLANLSSILANTSMTTDQRTIAYYQALASYGFTYGALALNVINNNNAAEQISNNFTADYAAAQGITYNSTTISAIRFGLAQADLTARNSASGNDIGYDVIEAYHQVVFNKNGLPIDAWSGFIPLKVLGQTAWNLILNNTFFSNGTLFAAMASKADLDREAFNFQEADTIGLWLSNVLIATAQAAATDAGTALQSAANSLYSKSVQSFQQLGYYTVQSGDTSSSIVSTLSNGGIIANAIDAATLMRLNAVFGITTLAVGTLLHVPVNALTTTSGSDLSLSSVAGNTYVYDPSSGKVFAVGSSLDGHDSGALIVDTPVFSGSFATFDRGTYSGFTVQANGNIAVDLTTPNGIPLGTLSFNPSTDTGVLTTSDGLSLPISVSSAIHLTDPVATPEQIFLSYLSELGDPLTATQLAQDNDNYLNPAQTSVVVQGSVVIGTNNTAEPLTKNLANDVFSGTTNNATITGTTQAVMVNGSEVVPTNVLFAIGDMTNDTLSNIQALVAGGNTPYRYLTLTAAQFNSFAIISDGGGGFPVTLTIADGGTVSLRSASIVPNPEYGETFASFNLVASGWEGTTLIGDNRSNEYLTASEFGNDTLEAGNGAGDTLIAGEGVDTLTGGTGGDTFDANNGLAAGSVIQGAGSNNILNASGDVSLATISGVQTLNASNSLTMSIAEYKGFTTINGTFIISDTAANVVASLGVLEALAGGTQLSSIILTDSSVPTISLTAAQYAADAAALGKISSPYNLSISGVTAANATTVANQTSGTSITVTDSSANVMANIASLETLALDGQLISITLTDSSAPNFSLTVAQLAAETDALSEIISAYNLSVVTGNDTGDTLNVYGSHGNNTLTVQDILSNNPGADWNNTLNAATSSGTNHLTVGDGSYDLLRADWATGTDVLTAGNGSYDYLKANSGSATDTLIVGNGNNNTLDTSFSSGHNTLTVGSGNNNYLNAGVTTGVNILTAGAGTGNTLDVGYSQSNNSLTVNGGSSDTLSAKSSTGNNTLSGGSGNNNTLDTSFSSGNNTLTVGNGSGNYLNAGVTTGVNILIAGDGANDTLDVGYSSKNNTLTAGNGSGDYLTANNSAGNNILTVGSGAGDQLSALWATGQNTLIAGTGHDTFFGGEGYTTYKFGAVFAQDGIYNGGSTFGTGASTVQGEIDFTSSSITYENLWFTQSGSDLVVQLLGTTDTITVKGWFGASAGAEVQVFKTASGVNLSSTAVAALVSAMATYQTANTSFSPATATTMPSDANLQAAITLAWPGSANTSGVTVATAIADQSTLDTISGGYKVVDNAANVVAGLAFLTSDATHIASITLTDGSTPTLGVTYAQYTADAAALGKIGSSYNLSITGVTAANASATAAATHVTSVTVSDTAANVLANIAVLETLATGTVLSSITLTDSTTPTLSLTSVQDSADSAVLGKIVSAYNLTVSNVLAANAASVATQAHFASETISDTAADFVASIASLETLAKAGEISAIAFTDSSKPTITLTSAQQTADVDALNKITSAYTLVITGGTVTAAVAATTTSVVSVSDTSANVLTYLSQLQTQATAGRISSIVFTDGTTPTLALTAAQLTADATVLGTITSAYHLSISGVTAANASSVAAQAHVTALSVSDTGANVVANIAALETLATGTKLSSITLTDSTTPTLSLTAAQFTADSAVLAKITGNYVLSIAQSGVNFNFTPNALASITTNGSTATYTVNSTAVGYTETISWASGGKALLTLTNNASGQSFATSLSWLTSGESLQISGSSATVYSPSGQALFATLVNPDGSQNDISYDAPGGSEFDNIFTYNAAGAETEVQYNNNNGTAVYDFFNPAQTGDPQVAQQFVNANGSGDVVANNLAVNYVNGDAPAVSIGTTGIVTVSVPHSGGSDIFTLASTGLTTNVGGHSLVDTTANLSVGVDASGNAVLTSGGSTLTEAANGSTDTFVIGSDTISLAASAVTSVLLDGTGAYDFALNSVAPGYSESLDWNPNTGKAILVITNLSTSASFATSLGYINPGYVLTANGSVLTNANGSQPLYSTQVNADGSQNDISYDAPGGSEFDNIYTYSATGVKTEVQYNNNNGTFVHDFYNSSGTLTGQTIYNADAILHSINSNITTETTTGMTTLDVNGTTSLTAAELSGFTSLTNGTGSADTIYATTAGTYSIAGKTVTGNFNLSAANTTANVTLVGNNQAGQVLTGGAGTDTLTVGTGNDTLNGGTGYTAYSFGTAFGQDTVNNAAAGNTIAKGEIDFASGITDEKLWFAQSGSNLVVDLLGTTDQITVSNWFGSNAGADVQTFNAGGLKLDTQVAQLVQAMASYASANTGFNPATATAMPTNTALQNEIAAAWHS